VRADLRGVDTHGLVCLPGYPERIAHGLLDPPADLTFESITPRRRGTRRARRVRLRHRHPCDGGGDRAGRDLRDRPRQRAQFHPFRHGGVVSAAGGRTRLRRTRLYQRAAGAAALGRAELFGICPFGAAFPGGPPFVLERAPTIVARGKIRKAAREGRPIPEGWALDAAGRPTTDPAKALEGVLLPIGGPKGAALSMMMHIFGGLFSGARFAGDVGNQ
jgi:LDH2 family malate/lactate/ureidoglycolate dehydrogenase